MNRRELLKLSGAAALAAAYPGSPLFAEEIVTASVHLGKARQKGCLLFLRVPLGKNPVDELIHPDSLGAGGIGLGNDEFSDGDNGCVLMRIEDLQRNSFGKGLVNLLK